MYVVQSILANRLCPNRKKFPGQKYRSRLAIACSPSVCQFGLDLSIPSLLTWDVDSLRGSFLPGKKTCPAGLKVLKDTHRYVTVGNPSPSQPGPRKVTGFTRNIQSQQSQRRFKISSSTSSVVAVPAFPFESTRSGVSSLHSSRFSSTALYMAAAASRWS